MAPDEEVVADNRFVRVVTKDGTTVTGKLLNQDAIGVQMMNPKEELKTYLRANIREYTDHRQGIDAVCRRQAERAAGGRHRQLLGSLKGS